MAPSDKASARDAAARDLPGADAVFVRVNGPEFEWFEVDLKLCATLGALSCPKPKKWTTCVTRRSG